MQSIHNSSTFLFSIKSREIGRHIHQLILKLSSIQPVLSHIQTLCSRDRGTEVILVAIASECSKEEESTWMAKRIESRVVLHAIRIRRGLVAYKLEHSIPSLWVDSMGWEYVGRQLKRISWQCKDLIFMEFVQRALQLAMKRQILIISSAFLNLIQPIEVAHFPIVVQ